MASRMGLRLRPRSVRLYSTRGAAALALCLTLLTAPALSAGLESLFWLFTYRLTLWPIAAVLPFFVLLGTAVPAASCRAARFGR